MVVETKRIERDVFSYDQQVQEIQTTCAPRQRALLSLLAVCRKHEIDASAIVASLADDLPRTPLENRRRTRSFYWSRVVEFSDELQTATSLPEALQKSPGLLPEPVEFAIRLEHNNGTFDEFANAWLNRAPDFVFNSKPNGTFFGNIFPVFLKAFVVMLLILYLIIRIVPDLELMVEDEFSAEIPQVLSFTMKLFDELIQYWFVPILIFVCTIPFWFRSIARYSKQWNPFVWKQPVLPNGVRTRQALAALAAHGKSVPQATFDGLRKLSRQLGRRVVNKGQHDTDLNDWELLSNRRVISKTESRALRFTDSNETQAWLLRKSAVTRNYRFDDRGAFWSRIVVASVNVAIGIFVMLLTISVYSVLITIMASLQ